MVEESSRNGLAVSELAQVSGFNGMEDIYSSGGDEQSLYHLSDA